MEVIKLILITTILVSFAIAGLALRVLIKKGGKFPNTHVGGNKHLKRQGVYCSQTQDKLEQRKAHKKIDYKNVMFMPDSKAGR